MESGRGCSFEGDSFNGRVNTSKTTERPRECLGLLSRTRIGLTLLTLAAGSLACTPHERKAANDSGGISLSEEGGDGQEGVDEGEVDSDGPGEGGVEEGSSLLDLPDDEETLIGCKEITFLFVVDNSFSMKPHQAALADSFPEFMNAIQSKLTQKGVYFEQYKIALIKTDSYWRQSCEQLCKQDDAVCEVGDVNLCEGNYNKCHDTLGAFVTWPKHQAEPCLSENGPRYITSQMPFEEQVKAFECLQPGDSGSGEERQLSALYHAIDLSDSGECNEGGMPIKGPMVITMITDEEDEKWWEAETEILAKTIISKVGGEENVVALGILPHAGTCDNADAPVLKSFFQKFDPEKVFIADVCSENYTSFFDSSVDVIVDTCVEYKPAE